jgi:uncharacterized membrane protein YgdD (TMEM256/DUF423 family)
MVWIKTASFFMLLGVALGAFGAHGLRDKLTAHQMEIYKTAVLYHFIHALGLFVVAWLSARGQNPKLTMAGNFFTVGIILFSGSLYFLALTGHKWLGAVTPLGGLSFLIGWALIFLAAK